MMGRRLNIAVIGCGEVAQCVHLPNLTTNHEQYKVTALCDVSEQALKLCSERFHVPDTFTSVDEMLASHIPIDAVYILSTHEYHAEQTIKCCKAGKHVLVEKPAAQTVEEVDAVEQARREAGVVVFVGYMRRYALALERLKEAIKGKEIKYVRVRDIIGDNSLFTAQSGQHLRYFRDIPQHAQTDLADRRRLNLQHNLVEMATKDPRNAHSMALLTTLGCHDLSAMRDVLGMPTRCIVATRSDDDLGNGARGSFWWNVIFEYPGFKAYFEMAIDQVALFDAHIEVYTNDSRVKIEYDTPYVKGLPVTLTTSTQLPNGDYASTTTRPTYTDPYVLEMQEFYEAVTEGKDYKTTILDSKNDILLANMIFGALVD